MATDTWNVRLVILGLIIICCLCLGLNLAEHATTQTDMIGSAALGGLTGILATTRSTVPPDNPEETP